MKTSTTPTRKRAPKKRAYASEVRVLAKEKTRAALLRATLHLVAERGLDGPSIDDICKYAGYTRGAFYAHFGDRETLILEAMTARRQATFGALVETLGDSRSLFGLIELLGKMVAGGMFPPKEGVRTPEFLQACRRSEPLRRTHLELLDDTKSRLAQMIRAAQKNGEARADLSADPLAAFLVIFEAGVEVMADLDWSYDVGKVTKVLTQMLKAEV